MDTSILFKKVKYSEFPKSIEGQERLFYRIIYVYWILFWPVTVLFKFLARGEFFTSSYFSLIFFSITSSIILLVVQLLRRIFNTQLKFWKKSNMKIFFIFSSLFFVLWGYIFIISLLCKTTLYAFIYFVEEFTIPPMYDAVFFIISMFGDVVIRLNRVARK